MPLVIADEFLTQAGLSEAEARLELACRLFDTGRLTRAQAARLADLTTAEFEDELLERRIPLYRPTPADVAEDLKALNRVFSISG
ncbi:MAG: UPF0175 family protein [Planctomycetes bacterium]|nr:UPF0175 family protein [Planctomycetota bacterium]